MRLFWWNLCPRKFSLNSRNESVQCIEEIAVIENWDETSLSDIQIENSGDFEQARLLLDWKPQKLYILVSEVLANKLKLKHSPVQTINIVTYGSDRSKSLQTRSTNTNLNLRNGYILSFTANIVPWITETIDRRPFNIFQD